MPTGYTAPVKDGKITQFEDFSLSCARGFGALILLRDSDQSLKATKEAIAKGLYFEQPTYYTDALAAARERLAGLRAMSDEDALEAARAEREQVQQRNAEMEETRLSELARYEAMIEKVEAWEPPTEDHASFKDFMLDQLRESIKFDCHPFTMPLPEVSLAWRDEKIARTEKEISRHEDEIRKQNERNEGRRKWVTQLLESFEAVPA